MNSALRLIRRKLRNLYHSINPCSRRKASEWENKHGPEFFKKIGLKSGDTILDLGCGPGHYALPAAKVTGPDGVVFAIDENPGIAKHLWRHASARGLFQIRVLRDISEAPDTAACRFILLFDMLHFHAPTRRQAIYEAVHRRLHPDGHLLVHPKHLDGDSANRYFIGMTARDLVAEIEEAGFCLDEKLATRLWHAHDTTDGVVWKFIKRDRPS